LKKAYITIHVDSGESVRAWFPDFPDLIIPGDRLADTLCIASLVLKQHIEQLRQQGLMVPEPTTPDIWSIYAEHPTALIGFSEV
jgi:predicted RNase H-like HicB family nuclease